MTGEIDSNDGGNVNSGGDIDYSLLLDTFLYLQLLWYFFVVVFLQVLILCPKNVLLNWPNEFAKWTEETQIPNIPLFCLNDKVKTPEDRIRLLREWENTGGVAIISFTTYSRSAHQCEYITRPDMHVIDLLAQSPFTQEIRNLWQRGNKSCMLSQIDYSQIQGQIW